jgi:hypothetical protein
LIAVNIPADPAWLPRKSGERPADFGTRPKSVPDDPAELTATSKV